MLTIQCQALFYNLFLFSIDSLSNLKNKGFNKKPYIRLLIKKQSPQRLYGYYSINLIPMQPLILIFIKLHFQLIFQQNILILRNLFCTIYLTYDDIHVMFQ